MTPSLRSATLADAEAISQVHIRSRGAGYAGFFPPSYLIGLGLEDALAMWNERLAQQDSLETILAETAGRLAGFTRFGIDDAPPPNEHAGAVQLLYVDPAYWRQGVGATLLAAAEQRLQDRGFRTGFLSVYEENQPAQRFYRSQGWSPDEARWTVERGGAELVQVRYVKALTPAQAG